MLNNLTTKFQEALMQAQQTAGRLGKPEISSLDVLVALLEQDGGILSPILRKASCDPGLLLQAAQREVSHEPTQSGATTQPQMGRDLATVMHAAEDERKKLKDDYLSVEHFMLGALDTQNKVHQLTDTFGLTKDNYLAAMKEVRGNQRVTNDNPEDTYNALQKYGQDLVDLARKQKLDPVIGTMACPVCGTALQPDDVWLKKGSSGWYTLSQCPVCKGRGGEAGRGVFQKYRMSRRDGLHWAFARCVQMPDDASLVRWKKQKAQYLERQRLKAERQAAEAEAARHIF